MSNSPTNMMIAIVVCGFFVVAAFIIPDMPIGLRAIWAIGGSLFIFLIVSSTLNEKRRKSASQVVPSTVTHRCTITCPPGREYYDIKDGDTTIHVERDNSDTHNPLDAAKQTFSNALTQSLPGDLAMDASLPLFRLHTTDLTPLGEMHRRLIPTRYQIYDPQMRLIANIKPTLQIGTHPDLKIEDPHGNTIAEYSNTNDQDYQLITPEGSIIATVTKTYMEDSPIYTIDIADTPTQPQIIYFYVIANDNINHFAALMSRGA